MFPSNKSGIIVLHELPDSFTRVGGNQYINSSGTKDEFALHWGFRTLVAALRKAGLNPHYEEFDDGHMNIAYRYDVSIPKIVKALV